MREISVESMDIVRSRRKALPRGLVVAVGVILVVAVSLLAIISLVRSGNGGPSVDRSTIVTDVARRGTLVRSVSAAGTLASENVHVIAAVQPGVIESVLVKPGATVSEGTPIAQLSNPDLQADVVSSRSAVDVARAQVMSAEQQAKASALVQRSSYVSAQAQAQEDSTNVQSLKSLNHDGYISDQTYRIAAIKAAQSSSQLTVARAQIGVDAAEEQAKVAQAQAQLRQARAQLHAKEAEVAALAIRARSVGVVQSVAVDPGARVDAGAEIARVADQRDLKSVLQVPEGQVHSVSIGMPVRIDTGNGVFRGRAARIAPSAQNGSVAVDVTFAHPLSAGARPDLNVDGTIELETMHGVVSIGRPAGSADDTTVSLYRIDPGTNIARLLQVRLGRGSADRIQALSGLEPGDTVIVSDTSAYGGAPTLRLR
ncbi:MAG: efflux RND transporter periplasmic adaptor subunit [Vulcanimicrobiaceae bacterium]